MQFRESDLTFVQRLLEEEGIYYFFKHEEAKHTLVLADSITAHEAATVTSRFCTRPKERRVAGSEEHFWAMKVRRALYPGRHTVLSGYDPTAMRLETASVRAGARRRIWSRRTRTSTTTIPAGFSIRGGAGRGDRARAGGSRGPYH